MIDYRVDFVNESGEKILDSERDTIEEGTIVTRKAEWTVKGNDGKDYILKANTNLQSKKISEDDNCIEFVYRELVDSDKDKGGYIFHYISEDGIILKRAELKSDIAGSTHEAKKIEFPNYKFKESIPKDGKVTLEAGKTKEVYMIYEWNGEPEPGPVFPPINPDPGPGEILPEEPEVPVDPETPEIDDKLNKEDHFAYIQGYPDQTVQPNGYLTREEAAVVFFRLLDDNYRDSIMTSKVNFPDVKEGRWSRTEIATLVNGGILNGYTDGTFKPAGRITRAELAKIVVEFDSLHDIDKNIFIDITNHWAEDYINSAAANNWIEGYPTGEFKPQNSITRAEFVTMVNRVLERVTKEKNMLPNRLEFKDLLRNKWYYEAMQEAINSHEYIKDEDGIEKWTKIKAVNID